mgnify:CR=1 FL=1
MTSVLIIGGAGYVGSKLVPELLKKNYKVKVLDLFIYGDNVLPNNPNLIKIKGDIRNINLVKKATKDIDILIHLACISNDPSFELNPELGKSINYDSFEPIIKIAIEFGVKRFIYASSSSVYGIKTEKNVTETMALKPLTDYSKYKAMCEDLLLKYNSDNFCCTVLRPATVCGYSPRQRLDVVVNIFSNLAYHKNIITVNGGSQLRPNININDMVRAYTHIIEEDIQKIYGQIFNVGFENITLSDLAINVKAVLGSHIVIKTLKTEDNRSYHISSDKIKKDLNFVNKYNIKDAIFSLKEAFDKKILLNTFEDPNYFNIKKMQNISLK